MCFGTCPVYKVKVNNKGFVIFLGIVGVRKKGRSTWKVPTEIIEKLNGLIEKLDFRNFIYNPQGSYATCHPSCITTIKFLDGLINTIDYDLGYFEYKNLERFENRIDYLIDTDRVVR